MKILVSHFCDTSDFSFRELFLNKKDPFEIIKSLAIFIEQTFKSGKLKANYKGSDNIFIGKGTRIAEGATILGPAIIGEECLIGHSALVRENCILGNGIKIGHASEIKQSIFLNNSGAAHMNYVGDSIIGNNVNLAGGSIIANYRLDKKNVTIKTDSQKIDTGLLKFGALVGDNSKIGANSVLNPGTLLGKNSIVFPLTSVSGIHKNNAVIK